MDCVPRLFDELLLPAADCGVQVTVVDNASESEVQKFLSQYADKSNLEIILLNDNLGVAKGRNRGFSCSQREYIVYLDDDSMIKLEELASVPRLFDENPDAGILAFRIVHGLTGDAQNEHGKRMVVVGNFHGAGHAIRRSLIQTVGYLDEECFFGAEELEFTMRALAGGMTTVYVPDITVKHYILIRKGQNLLRRTTNWARNYAMVLFRYLPFTMALLFSCRLLVSYMVSGIKTLKLGVVLLPTAMLTGAFMGLRSRNTLDDEGVKFYSDQMIRPEIGNVSISSKILRRYFTVFII
jgi:GT2 family glycosyltransferase